MLLTLFTALSPALPIASDPPRLVVIVSVDQLFHANLARLEPHLDGGLGRFLRSGAVFPDAELPYANTSTGPGHGTLATGCFPNRHGLVGNEYWDPALRRKIYCVGDVEARLVTRGGALEAAAEGRTSRNLWLPAIGDRFRSAFPESRIVALSGKDRGALTLGGASPDLCLWWYKGHEAGFATSSTLARELPAWVARMNLSWPAELVGYLWEPSFDLSQPPPGTAPDDRAEEGAIGGRQRAFPYPFPVPATLNGPALETLAIRAYESHWIDKLVLRAAREALQRLELGADATPDLLTLSFSACDTVGHRFGPYSCETTDVLLRLDDELGSLFDLLDERVGAQHWIAALSSDHGVLPLPGAPSPDSGPVLRVTTADVDFLKATVTLALAERYGEVAPRALYIGGAFAIDHRAVTRGGLDLAEVRRVVAEVVETTDWIAHAYTFEELTGSAPTNDEFLRLERMSTHPARCPDVAFVRVPSSLEGSVTGTSHGAPYGYDRRIPLAFYGPGFAAGTHAGAASSADVVPTLLHAIGLEVPADLDGRVLGLQ